MINLDKFYVLDFGEFSSRKCNNALFGGFWFDLMSLFVDLN